MTDTTGWARIDVALPLPMEVAGTLMTLIGTAWPDARVDTNGRHGYGLSMLVDPRVKPKRVTKKAAAEIKAANDPEGAEGATFDGFSSDGEGVTAHVGTPEEIALFIGGMVHDMLSQVEGATNYFEWQVHTESGDRYVLAAGRSKGQTPGALLAEAKAHVKALLAHPHPEGTGDVDAAERWLDRVEPGWDMVPA
jgi:hypothetical protein